MGLFDEKPRGQKSRDTVPLKYSVGNDKKSFSSSEQYTVYDGEQIIVVNSLNHALSN
jgi:hypothetical protein